jgi:hypothetical protein
MISPHLTRMRGAHKYHFRARGVYHFCGGHSAESARREPRGAVDGDIAA